MFIMQIEFNIINLQNSKLEQAASRCGQERLCDIVNTFDTVKFLGICEYPTLSCLIGIVEFNNSRYPVSLSHFRNLQIESLGDFFKLVNQELVVRKDGDKFFFELA